MKPILIIIGQGSTVNVNRAKAVARDLNLSSVENIEAPRPGDKSIRYARWSENGHFESNGDYPRSVPDSIENYAIIDLSGFDETRSIQLNAEYVAVITDKEVKVGCQSFSHEKILEVAKIVESM